MANADNALLRMETGQQSFPMAALTDTGDAATFEGAAAPWSGRGGFEPTVRPDGVINGGKVTPGTTNNTVNVEAITCNLAGVETVVPGSAGVAVTRATTSTHMISSITVDETGAIDVVAGTEGTSFSEARGAAGGPPYVPVGSIEVAQVRLNAQASALVAGGEIFQVVGLHQERADSPLYTVKSYTGEVVFAASLPSIHTGDTAKGVYASFATPIFSDVPKARNNVVPEESYSLSSESYYGGAEGSVSRSLNQGAFECLIKDGITDIVVKLAGENLWFEFLPNKYRTSQKIAYQGILGISRQWPAEGAMVASCTVSAGEKGQEVGA